MKGDMELQTESSGQAAIRAKASMLNRNSLWYRIKSNRIAYLFISPWILLFCMFTAYPLFFSLYVSLTDFNPLRKGSINEFVGLDNYKELLVDANFHIALKNTFIFALGTIPVTTVFALFLAVALNQSVKLKALFRVGFFFPTVTSVTVIATLFRLLLFRDGLLTRLVEALGLEGRNWLLDQYTALPCIMAMCVWSATGYYMVIYLSALQTIPEELYESSTMDGAGAVRKFIYITLPHLRHVTLYVIVVNTINSLQIFTEPQIMTQGGPVYATTTGVLYLYRQGFTSQRMGYASAVGYALFVIILLFALLQTRILRLDKGVGD